MHLFSIIANSTQIVLLLGCFVIYGPHLAGPVILIFFLLLLIGFLNLLSQLFHAGSPAGLLLFTGKRTPLTKRQNMRITYSGGTRPTLIIDCGRFRVLDIAENGVRFSVASRQRLKRRIRGKIELVCGRTIAFDGKLLRRESDEACLKLKESIECSLIKQEKEALKLH